ncbi:aminoglycoside phosphotransferase (APT) family kinase protein [Streptosporangium becharense]|uniref:Aminoglycoside phosphotransferase (APT) family kinase protein n=1 Tax=Streptosporangium becharense TaxID=1816182 RepID=A0A7W9IKY2_9ACTN|nr:phosphotransferase family protein [Streptosporangium becharense]MBB2911519.1 aminoglycoside phosphotransferase (APT) family kinase protein [Streptosporangium becharense]MBB5822663.1 aminoglycoside phosphotransferase (APT) family kinase protein [Streptosporangium becharense]
MTSLHIDVTAIDFDVLGAWMDEQGLPGGPFEQVAPVTGGTQNVMVRFTRGGAAYVLRRPPLHPRARSNEVLRREARVLTLLRDTPVPAPRLVAACTDENVMGAVFYLMEPVDGFNAAVGLPEPHASDPAIRHRMGLEAASALTDLGRVDHRPLDGFGRPEGFLERQVPRWMGELDGYAALEGYPGPDIPGLEETAAWLERNRPRDFTPGIMHGDYHLANLMFACDGPRVAAIVDWEMCTVGDPLVDLGWLLATWPSPDGTSALYGGVTGLATTAELVECYAALSDRDVSAADWYAVLACFKLGIVLEGTHARACAGRAPKELGDLLHATTLNLFARARAFM